MRELFADRYRQVLELDQQVAAYGVKVQRLYQESAVCRKIGAGAGDWADDRNGDGRLTR